MKDKHWGIILLSLIVIDFLCRQLINFNNEAHFMYNAEMIGLSILVVVYIIISFIDNKIDGRRICDKCSRPKREHHGAHPPTCPDNYLNWFYQKKN